MTFLFLVLGLLNLKDTRAAAPSPPRMELIAEVNFPTTTVYDHLPLGGLSGITYVPERKEYLAVSDDNGKIGPPRMIRLAIEVDPVGKKVAVKYLGTVSLTDRKGKVFAPGQFDAEGIAYVPESRRLFMSTEGSSRQRPEVDPGIFEFNLEGRLLAELPLPAKFRVVRDQEKSGSRTNLGFEGLSAGDGGKKLFAAMENALIQDGETASLKSGSRARILKYSIGKVMKVAGDRFYTTDAIPNPTQLRETKGDNGISEILSTPSELFVLERSFVPETAKVNCRIYSWVRGQTTKKLVYSFNDTVDNLEGMALGPKLPDGRRVLIVVSDNNFNPLQRTQFIALALGN